MRVKVRHILMFAGFVYLLRVLPDTGMYLSEAFSALFGEIKTFVISLFEFSVGSLWGFLPSAALLTTFAVLRIRESRRSIRSTIYTGFDHPTQEPPLLSDEDFARVVTKLATPEPEVPERPVTPTPRALTDGAWDTWTEGNGMGQWRNGLPALDRPFTLRTDCQSGHVAEHHVGEHWQEAGTNRTRVTRICRFVCHSTWSEIA
jgi:hypothetical protein